ncbi:hypothetical protein QAD02_005664 [Eretmocerus hayati]|uniref:Uncharacterized protein n=1 Tax=Eretmocerus hayati TaxID=131215 RepID=A0ACC2NTK8_9HYME|nr:hypothetical protein QAD02_005664 [Eretmocerus hayati]
MGLKEFKILFDNPYAAYNSGQTITGRVILTLESTKKIRGIKLKVKGEADTYWSTDRQELNNEGRYVNETDVVTAHEEYFDASFYLIGSASGGEIELPAGTHTYPFNYVIPPNLPSSFESDFGRIRYTAKASLDRPWKFDQETKVAFTVVSNFDLNLHESASQPLQLEANKSFCCLCCGSPPLSINLTLPVRGYVPGQTIPVKVNVENQSGKTVDSVKLALLKVITYSATTPRSEKKVVELKVAEVSKGPVGGNETTSYEQSLDVPPLPPSNLQNCGIIDLEYQLKVEACVSGLYYRNLIKTTPIYIGTIPLSNYQMPQPTAPRLDEKSDFAPPTGDSSGLYPPILSPTAPEGSTTTNLYPALAPPSYEEAVTGGSRTLRDRDESEHVIGAEQRFVPKYPVYNFKSSD